MQRSIALLGSTGSIGQSALDLVRRFPGQFSVDLLAAGTRIASLADDIREFKPKVAAVGAPDAMVALREQLQIPSSATHYEGTELIAGSDDLCAAIRESAADVVLAAVVGMAGLPGVLAAAETGKMIALANKESLVVAGELVMRTAALNNAMIVPVDSEHSAIFQCLDGLAPSRRVDLTSVILTSSGGPFRTTPREEFAAITVERALKHPKWSMGAKISIDSATMMNKALEVIEAHWLFDVSPEQIEVVVHPEHIIHSFVRFCDGSILAQLALPDMRGPISYALTFPHGRLKGAVAQLDLCALGTLHFEGVDRERFPAVSRAYEVLRAGGAMPAVFNAANEVAVGAFLDHQIPFVDINRIVGLALEHFSGASYGTLGDLQSVCEEVTEWSRQCAGIVPK